MEKIEPTTTLKENEKYKLEDKDYLLLKALESLTDAVDRLSARLAR